MSDRAREVILERIASALGGSYAAAPIPRDYRRQGAHLPGTQMLLELLTERLEDYKATVRRATEADIATVIADMLPEGGRLIVPPGLPTGWAPPSAVIDDGHYDPTALDSFDAVLTTCAAAAADTGTIALDGSEGQGRRALSLVPDWHVCVVRAEQIVQTVPEFVARLDPRRPLTLVSGPSATSDIELHRVEGVHGPRHLAVILLTP